MDGAPPSEAPNELTQRLDELTAEGFVRALRGVDAQLFSGWCGFPGLLDARTLLAAENATVSSAMVMRRGGTIVLTGCGTSGRIAFLTARRYQLLSQRPERFAYLISGGDAAILLSDELPEDDAEEGAAQLTALAKGKPAVSLIGISCGLSAPYVAGQLAYAFAAQTVSELVAAAAEDEIHAATAGSSSAAFSLAPAYASVAATGFATCAIGFNPVAHARNTPIAALGNRSFRDIVVAIDDSAAHCTSHNVLNPVVGPEAVAGSSRLKGGSATLALADAMCYRALALAEAAPARLSDVDTVPKLLPLLLAAQQAVHETYAHPEALAGIATLAANAMRAGGRLFYIGAGVAGIIGCIDASEMPDTFGVPFDTVRGFVQGGWATMRNREGNVGGAGSPLLCLSIADFERDVLPTIGAADCVLLIGCGREPRRAAPIPSSDSALPTPSMWGLVPKVRECFKITVTFHAIPSHS